MQYDSSAATLQDGRFIVTWADYSESSPGNIVANIRGQLFSADGVRLGGEFLVNTTVTGDQSSGRVAALSQERFVVAWSDARRTGNDTSGAAIRAQIFASDGTRSGLSCW